MAKKWGPAAIAAVPMMRPGAQGLSAQVCARCGRQGHTSLDPSCPANTQIAAALQAAARRSAAQRSVSDPRGADLSDASEA